MKTLKLFSAGLLACAAASLASAITPTVVDVAGSTAFRTAAVNAEIALLNHAGANLPGGVSQGAFIGSSLTGATISVVYGYDGGGNEIMFRNHWSGSAAGVYDCANATVLSQLPVTTTLANTPAGNSVAAGSDTDTGSTDIAFTDSQAADAAATVVTGINGSTFANTINSAGLINAGTTANKNKGVAVVTFQWCLGVNASDPTNWAAINYNLTQQQGATLISQGFISLADVTANSADATTFLLFVGRNEDSGTREAYEAESLGGGTLNNANAFGAAVNQYMVKQSGVAYPTGPLTDGLGNSYPAIGVVAGGVTGFKLWPRLQAAPANTGWTVNTIPSLTWKTIGHSGYNGGGDVSAILRTPDPVAIASFTDGVSNAPAGATKIYFVSWLGTSDVNTVTGAGGKACSYNGIPFSANAVAEGQYTAWTFEHIYYLPALAGVQKTAADGLADTFAGFTTAQIGAAGMSIGDLLNGLARGQGAGSRIP